MNEIFGIQILLQSKNALQLNKTEKYKIGNLLQESSHFKLAINSQESKKNIVQLYKHIVLKKYVKKQFIYHKVQPDNHLFVILKGQVACFIPNFQANLLGIESNYNNEKKYNEDNINSQKPINKADEDLLDSDIYRSHLYFSGNYCHYTKIKELQAGETFGVYTQFHDATFIATEDTYFAIIPRKKYELFFQPEVYRYYFVNQYLADMFCENEQNVRFQIQDEENFSARNNLQGITPISSGRKINPNLLSSIFSNDKDQFSNRSKSNMTIQSDINKTEMNFSSKVIDLEKDNEKKNQINIEQLNNNNGEEIKVNEEQNIGQSNQSIQIQNKESSQYEEKKQNVVLMLIYSELSYHFETIKFEDSKYIYNESDIVDYYYLIQSGKMLLKKSGLQDTIQEYGEGDFLGFEDESFRRIFSCFVESGTVAYRIHKNEFEKNINDNLLSLFKQIQRYKKKKYTEIYKQMQENVYVQGLQHKIKNLNSRDIQYKIQLKKQIAQELLHVMQNPKFGSAQNFDSDNQQQNVQFNQTSNQFQLNSHRSTNSNSKISENSSRQRTGQSLNCISDQNKKLNVKFSLENDNLQYQRSSQKMPQSSFQEFTRLSSPLKIQHAQRMVVNEVKKATQQAQSDKKIIVVSNTPRDVNISFVDKQVIENQNQQKQPIDMSPLLNRNLFLSQSLLRSSSCLNRQPTFELQNLSPLVKSKRTLSPMIKSNRDFSSMIKQNRDISPLIKTNRSISQNNKFDQNISPIIKTDQNMDNSQFNFPKECSSNNSKQEVQQQQQKLIINRSKSQFSEQDLSPTKNNLNNYKNLATFSNIYHNKKKIITISSLNTCYDKKDKKSQQQDIGNNKNEPTSKNSLDDNFVPEIDDIQEQNIENPEWLKKLSQKTKGIDVASIKNNVERQILNMPQFYQDKLWGQNAYKTKTKTNKFSQK